MNRDEVWEHGFCWTESGHWVTSPQSVLNMIRVHLGHRRASFINSARQVTRVNTDRATTASRDKGGQRKDQTYARGGGPNKQNRGRTDGATERVKAKTATITWCSSTWNTCGLNKQTNKQTNKTVRSSVASERNGDTRAGRRHAQCRQRPRMTSDLLGRVWKW